MAGWQATLWGGSDELTVMPLTAPIEWIDRETWVLHQPAWVHGGDRLFVVLRDTAPWQGAERVMYDRVVAVPRLFARLSLHDAVVGVHLAKMAELLEARLDVRFSEAGANFYRDGQDSVAWHSDHLPPRALDDSVVALVSLGGRRELRMRPKSSGSTWRGRFNVPMDSGDLFVMGGACQRRWEHAVPKSSTPEPRISLAFRTVREKTP